MHHAIKIVIDEKEYSGEYYIEKGVLHVLSAYGAKATQPGAAPQAIARILLREIVESYRILEFPSKSKDGNRH